MSYIALYHTSDIPIAAATYQGPRKEEKKEEEGETLTAFVSAFRLASEATHMDIEALVQRR